MTQNMTRTQYLTAIIKRLPILILGFLVIAVGVQIMINSKLGLNPWGIFHSGLAHSTGITFGRASQMTGLGIILICFLFKIYPGIGTILNMLCIGFFVDLIATLGFLPIFDSMIYRVLSFLFGNFIFALGVYIYLVADLGSGPRDSLMLALTRLTRFTAGQCKIMMEVTAAVAGFIMGGSVGLGTILAVLSGGLFIDLVFKFFKYNPKSRKLTNLVINYRELKSIGSEKTS